MSHAENILGALALAVADRLNRLAEEGSGCSQGGAIALTQIGQRDRPAIEDLRACLDVDTHSAATRVVARLEADDLVAKTKDPKDGRYAHLMLTEKGKRLQETVLAEREHFLRGVLDILSEEERQTFEALVFKLLSGLPFDVRACDRTCRLCDTRVCSGDDCPVQVR
ncbi:winged helix-turn-helix transcriptional regulator [Stappia sp. F7233]|uniref:Winged helix-turn-helix transcriptional regulator n=1 Tax=Stappia albiluteola TaxID=2758565 RepID=A0A839ABY2_9HYPH|nr:MarR family winged helix-turn-helix transcriptional regulator [Stappia albiluteola]MBA5776397.1 winged helix-turn-helix transcriptional regulator [Stappia albiluteola]